MGALANSGVDSAGNQRGLGRAAVLPLLACAVTGCILDIGYDGTRYRCSDGPDCPPGFVCVGGYCEPEGDDASVTDAATFDAPGGADAAVDAAPPPPLPIGNLITFTFDNVYGNVVPNRAGNRLVGEMTHAAGVAAEGKYGKAFAPAAAVLGIPKDPALFAGDHVTIEAWVKRDSDTSEDTVFSDRNAAVTPVTTYHVALYSAGNGTRFRSNDGCENGSAGITSFATNVAADVWTHLAVVWDGAEVTFYLDGVVTETLPLVATPCYSASKYFLAGLREDGTDPFDGLIDEVKLSDYAKSGAEIVDSMSFDSTALVSRCGDYILEVGEACDIDTTCCDWASCGFVGNGTSCGAGSCQSGACVSAGGRITAGLVALYEFDEGSGTMVGDTSGVAPAVDLEVADGGAVTWLSGGLRIDSATIVASSGAAAKIATACQASNEVTVEAWVDPANNTQDGPARVVTMSEDTGARNFQLGQDADTWQARLRSALGHDNGGPYIAGREGGIDLELTHLVLTRSSAGVRTLYVNGAPAATNVVGGDLSTWGSYGLALADEFVEGGRSWLGEYYLVAVYDRALSAAEVGQNFAAGE